jgi:hypothetical protein
MPLVTPTDADLLADLAWRHTEDLPLTSGLWTLPELAAYLTERQNRFNALTGVVVAHQAIAVGADSKAQLPADWISTFRVSWHPSLAPLAGRTFAVPRGDRFAGYLSQDQPDSARPTVYDDHAGGTRILELFPPPAASDGTLDLLYLSTLTALALTPGSPIPLSIPADFVPYVLYGVMADMLHKSGRGQDLERASYCDRRFEEGVGIARLLFEGFA